MDLLLYLFIVFGVGVCILFVSIILSKTNWMIVGLTMVLFSLVGIILKSSDPTAMDVYNGKTELQYTVVHGQKIDSVVVFKEKYKNGK